jgi:hypothetical protein
MQMAAEVECTTLIVSKFASTILVFRDANGMMLQLLVYIE